MSDDAEKGVLTVKCEVHSCENDCCHSIVIEIGKFKSHEAAVAVAAGLEGTLQAPIIEAVRTAEPGPVPAEQEPAMTKH